MTDKTRFRLMWVSLIANSVLLGALVGLVVYTIFIHSIVADQDLQALLGGARAPQSTEWVMMMQPTAYSNIGYLASAVTATSLFLTYYFYFNSERPSGPTLCLSMMLMIALLVASYFTFCVLGLQEWKIEQIRFGMGPSGAEKYRERYRYSRVRNRPPPWVPSEAWGAATAAYVFGLLALGFWIRRNRAEQKDRV